MMPKVILSKLRQWRFGVKELGDISGEDPLLILPLNSLPLRDPSSLPSFQSPNGNLYLEIPKAPKLDMSKTKSLLSPFHLFSTEMLQIQKTDLSLWLRPRW